MKYALKIKNLGLDLLHRSYMLQVYAGFGHNGFQYRLQKTTDKDIFYHLPGISCLISQLHNIDYKKASRLKTFSI